MHSARREIQSGLCAPNYRAQRADSATTFRSIWWMEAFVSGRGGQRAVAGPDVAGRTRLVDPDVLPDGAGVIYRAVGG
jgi:hypothetical protein